MATVIIRHKVGNFDTWLKGHQDRMNVFTPLVTSFKTFQDADDPNSIAMVMEVTDMEQFIPIGIGTAHAVTGIS